MSLIGRIRAKLGLPPRVVRRRILNFDLQVHEGFTYDKVDYDEGWLYLMIHQCRSFYDVGCNVGLYSLLACLENPARRVVAIEPNPAACALAAANLRMNGVTSQITFVESAVGDQVGQEARLHAVGSGAAGSVFKSHVPTAEKKGASIAVKLTTLDWIMDETKVVPDLVKIDIEGYEAWALEGACKMADLQKTRFMIEVHSGKELPMKTNGERILKWCRDHNYDAYYLKQHLKVETYEPFADRGRCHLMLQPKGWGYPPHLNELSQSDPLEKAQELITRNS
jgi:FkbM family methyltransferase